MLAEGDTQYSIAFITRDEYDGGGSTRRKISPIERVSLSTSVSLSLVLDGNPEFTLIPTELLRIAGDHSLL